MSTPYENYSEEHLRHRKAYQKKYRARKRAERAAADPVYAERARKRLEFSKMSFAQKDFATLERHRLQVLGWQRDRAALRAATDIDFALRSARTRYGKEECKTLTDDEIAERRRQKRRVRTQTKKAALLRADRLPSEQTLSAPSGCSAEL